VSDIFEHQNKGKTLLIWDKDGIPLINNSSVILWRSFDEDGNNSHLYSIPSIVEKNSDLFKSRYLSWLYNLGNKKLKERRVFDVLELRPGLNYWWLTLIIEKSNYAKSPQIDNIINFLAFEEWAKNKSFNRILLESHNDALSESIGLWCANKDIDFERKNSPSHSFKRKSFKSYFYHLMPKPIQALIWLAHYLIRRWPLRMVGIDEWKQTKASVVFVSYLFNLSSVHLKEGKFESNHWTKLPKQLQVNNCKTNWIHIYIEDKLLPTAKRAAKSIKKFNKNHKNFQVHVTLDTFLSLKIVSKTLVDWVMLIRKSAGVSNALAYKDVIWPLIEEDWKKSILGDSAVSTLLQYNLMESAINMLPRQDKGIYLQENQGWEFGFIQIWRKRKNGVLIGTPHSTVRYWDLRYFFDSRHYHDSGLNSLPLPDKIAVNGLAAKKQYLKGGYPENKIVVVEALRYYHLDKIVSKYVKNNLKESKLNILIVLDFLNKNIEYQLSLLRKSLNLLTCKVHLIVKPHPANHINTENFPELEMEVTTESIASCMHRCDIVFASNATSAAVDAYCLGGRVIVVNNPETLNQSPLRGIRSVSFVSTPKDLASALSNVNKINQEPINKNDFFYFDQNLTEWCKQIL